MEAQVHESNTKFDSIFLADLNIVTKKCLLVKNQKNKYQNEAIIYEQLIKIIKASALIDNFEKTAGKAMSILRKMFKIIQWENFSKIRLQDCSLRGLSFVDCQFQQSQMKNAKLTNCWFINCCMDFIKWENIISLEQRWFRHSSQILQMKHSPDRNTLASYTDSQVIQFWDFNSGKMLSTFKKFSDPSLFQIIRADLTIFIYTFKFALWNIFAGKKLKSYYQTCQVSKDKKIVFHQFFYITQGMKRDSLFSLISGKILRKIPFKEKFSEFDVQPNNYLEAFIHNEEIYIWDFKKGQLLFRIQNCPMEFIFSPVQELIAFIDEDSINNNIQWWDVKQRTLKKRIDSEFPYHIRFSGDGQIFSFCDKENINFYNVKTGEQTMSLIFDYHGFDQHLFMNSPNEKFILRFSQSNIVLADPLVGLYQNKISDTLKRIFFFSNGKKLLVYKENNHSFMVNLVNGKWTEKKYFIPSYFQIANVKPQLNLFALLQKRDKQIIQVCNYEQEKIICEKQFDSKIYSIGISHDSQLIAFGYDDCSVGLREISTFDQLKIFVGHEKIVKVIEFSLNNEKLISMDIDKYIILWSVETGSAIRTFQSHSQIFSFSPSSKLLALGSKKSLALWDLQNNKLLPQFQNQGQDCFCSKWIKIIFIKENLLLTALKNAYIWNIDNGNLLKQFDNSQNWIDWAYSPKNQILASITYHSIHQYQLYFDKQSLQLYNHSCPLLQMQSNFREQLLISCDQNGQVVVFDLKQQSLLLKTLFEYKFFCFTISSNFIAYGCQDFSIQLLNTSTFQIQKKFQSNKNQITCLEFSKDEKLLCSGHEDGQITIWELQTEKICKILYHNLPSVKQVKFYKNNQQLISFHIDKTIHFWDINNNQFYVGFYKHQNEIDTFALNSDENIIAFGSLDFKIYLLDIEKKTIISEFLFHESNVNVIAFSLDSKYLASGSDDSTICIINIENESLIDKIFSNGGKVRSLVFLNDELSFAYSNDENVIMITFTELNLSNYSKQVGCVKIYQNQPVGITFEQSSLTQASIISQHGFSLI